MGSGVRGLASPHPFLGATTSLRQCSRSSSSPSCSRSGGAPDSVRDQRAGHSSCVQSWLRGGGVLLSRFAWFDSGYMSCVCSGVLLDFFSACLWYSAPEVDSVLLSRVGAALVVDLGFGTCLLVLLVTVHLALCSLRFCWPENGEVAQTMLRLLYLPRSGNYFHEPLVPCSHLFAVRALCRGVFGSPR